MKNKHLFSFVTAMIMMFSNCAPLPVKISVPLQSSAETEAEYTTGTYEQLSYRNYGDHIEITDCDYRATEVVIPSEIDGLPVTVICGYISLFDEMYIETFGFARNENLTSVIIPDSVTSIGFRAFYRCENLTSIKIPNSVISIENLAFEGTPWLEEKKKENPLVIINNILIDGTTCEGNIIIPDGVTSINNGVFHNSNVASIIIPDSIMYIDEDAFCCRNLTSVNISEKNKYYSDIDGVIFNKNKTELIMYPAGKVSKEYIIPDNVISIGRYAFRNCTNLTSITIPDSVRSIGHYAFIGTPWLEEKKKENPLVIINNILIDGTTCEGDIVISDGVTSIAELAFDFCRNLTSITILNPECEIYDDSYTISNCYKYNELNEPPEYFFCGTIYGYANSTAQEYAEKYGYKFESLGEAPTGNVTEIQSGDTNGDGKLSLADAVLIAQAITNPNDYNLTEEQKASADVVDKGDGLTPMDALAIQMVDLKIITENDLPITSAEINRILDQK